MPTLTANPTAQSYPNTAIGADSPVQKIILSNIGYEATGPVSHVIDGNNAAEFVISGSTCGQPLAYNSTCEVSVIFRPISQGTKSARLTASASPGGTFSVILSASSTSPAAATINPMIGTFQPVPILPANSSTAPMPQMIAFTVTNTGGSSVVLDASTDGTDAADFQKADGCSGVLLQAGMNCTITIFFLPTTAGTKTASLTVTGDHVKLQVPLSGAANNPATLMMTPPMQEFGSVAFGMSNVQQFSVTNTGGQASGKLSTTIVGPSAAGFSITNSTCIDVLNPGDFCTILVTFAPTAPNGAGQKTALLNVSAPMGGNLTATLSGTASAPVAMGMLTLVSFGGSNPFGQVSIGNTSTAIVSVQNNGTVATGKIMATLAGPGNEFAVTNLGCPDSLAIGDTCLITLSFTPQVVTPTKSVTLQVFANPGGFAALALNATAVSGPSLTISPNFAPFGSRRINSTTTTNPTLFTVRNNGSDVSGPVTVALEGTDMGNFQIVATDCQNVVLQPRNANSCTVRVRFAPIATGNLTAYLAATGTPGGTTRATLTGTGTP